MTTKKANDVNNSELLQFAIEHGMIDLDTIQEQIKMNERKKYLESHTSKIWQGLDGKWRTYLYPNDKRKLICKKEIKELEDEIVNFYKNKTDEPTLKEVFYLWTEKKLEYGEIQKQTIDRYKTDLNYFFGDNEILNKKIKYITENELEDFIRITIHKKQLSSKAWGNLRTLINGMFKYAKKEGYTHISISTFMSELDLSKRIFTNKQKEELECVFSEEELKKLIDYLKETPKLQHLGILLAIYTGMRVGEIVGLKNEDIYNDYIYVRRTQIRYKDEANKTQYEVRDNPKTDAGIRKIIISNNVKSIIKQIKMINFGKEFLFTYKDNRLFTIHTLTMALYRACEKVGIPKRSMHVLRKTYATRLINAGVDEAIVISQMGHTDFTTTKNYYYYNDKTISQIAERIQKAINL